MSATRPSNAPRERRDAGVEHRDTSVQHRDASVQRPVPRDMSRLRARRAEANRRRRLLRLDLGIGVFVAIVLLIVTPGLAIAALCAGALVLACVVSVVVGRRRGRGSRTSSPISRDARSS